MGVLEAGGPDAGPGGLLRPEELVPFRQQVEGQRLRSLKRYLHYEERVRSGRGLEELHQWLGQILFDASGAYSLADRALAFEIGACEALARDGLAEDGAQATVVVAGPLDRLLLYRQLLTAGNAPGRRATFLGLLRSRYRRHWGWIRSRALVAPAETEPPAGTFQRFLAGLDELDPMDLGGGGPVPVAELEHELERARTEGDRLREYLEASRDRAESALARLREAEVEIRNLRRSLREETEGAEKLRSERTRRIKSERDCADLARDLERVRAEYLKLDRRLREMAARATGSGPGGRRPGFDLGRLERLAPTEVLGLQEGADGEALGQARRRFAAAFHS
ncbi:MAG: hypothetical protein ABIL09_28615, partial [Gemmatimonadota bacterium]